MDNNHKGIMGGIYIKPNVFETIQNKEDDIWIGINHSIMFVDDSWMLPKNENDNKQNSEQEN